MVMLTNGLSQITVGSAVRRARQGLGLTQEQVAVHTGLSIRTLRDIELGRVTRPHPASIRALEDVLDLPADDLRRLIEAAENAAAEAPGLDIGVLGPLTVRRDATAVDIPQAMPRNLLGLLALHPGRVVTRASIIETLWADDPPRTCEKLVHDYVGRLRRNLEPNRRKWAAGHIIRSVSGGYLLELSGGQLDLSRFDELAAAGAAAHQAGRLDQAHCWLSEALSQWRGPVLTDCCERLRRHPAVVSVTQRLVSAAVAAADTALDLGYHAWVLEHLPWVVDQAPLHESLHTRLILALAANGDQAAALAHFSRIRARLAEDLGVDPTSELAAAHLRVLRGEVLNTGSIAIRAGSARREEAGAATVPAPVRPAQLPPDTADFTGRDEVLARLDRLLLRDREDAGTALPIAVVTGVAGVGKTALAAHWAHRVRGKFTDGQLYLNLRGYSADPPLSPLEGLCQFLSALGVPSGRIPADCDAASALFRSLVMDRQLLVLLDNAAGAEQVRPLLPSGPGCAVLVTSRAALVGLIVRDGAEGVALDGFSPHETGALLTTLLGNAPAQADRPALAELGQLCGHLPLALRIAAAHLTQNADRSVSAFVGQMRDGDRLAVLNVVGDCRSGVRDVFQLSYDALMETERQLFRLLALVPGQNVAADHAAALLGLPRARGQELLDSLASEHLLQPIPHGRYAIHDLLHLYARELNSEIEPPAVQNAAMRRLYDYYAQAANAAAHLLYPHKTRLSLCPARPAGPPGGHRPPFTTEAEALAWLDAERDNLVAAVRDGAEYGLQATSCFLADAMRGYFWLSMHVVEWSSTGNSALHHASATEDMSAAAAAHLSLGDLHCRRGENSVAARHYAQAALCARRSGWLEGRACALGSLARLHRRAGRLERAVILLREALALTREDDRSGCYATNLSSLGLVYSTMGRLSEARDCYLTALSLHRSAGSRTGEAVVLANLGLTYHLMGDLPSAHDHLSRALAMQRELGDRGNEPTTLQLLAAVELDIGDHEGALAIGTMALSLARSTGRRGCEADALNVIGSAHQALGAHSLALEHHSQALTVAREVGERYAEPTALLGIAAVHGVRGDADRSTEFAELALASSRRYGFRLLETEALQYQRDVFERHPQRPEPRSRRRASA